MKIIMYLLIIMVVASILLTLITIVSWIGRVTENIIDTAESHIANKSSDAVDYMRNEVDKLYSGADNAIRGIEIGLIIAFVAMFIAIFVYSRRR